jgi:hypothetical protein
LREDIAMRGIGLNFGGSKIEGGIDHTGFQRIKVRGAGQLPCLLAFGKILRVREMASDALQKLDGKGLPESERENACNRSPSILALLLMFPQEQQPISITIMATMIRPGRVAARSCRSRPWR